jgi:hypothetical protein
MTFPAPLRVSAIVAAVALLGCGDDGMSASGLSGNSISAGESSSMGSSFGSSGSGVVTAAETGEPTSGSSNSAGDSTTGEPTTTGVPGTTTSGPDLTTGDDTTGVPGTTTTNGGAMCGNGAIDGNEQCDGANLNGFTCEALGNAGGTLQCDPVTCTFDTQLCEGGGGTSG